MYEVYEVTYKGKCVYIGAGLIGRSAHCMSGHSHNPHLNELYFRDKDNMSVLVLRTDLSKEEAFECEKEFIFASMPEFNIVHNPKKSRKFRRYTI